MYVCCQEEVFEEEENNVNSSEMPVLFSRGLPFLLEITGPLLAHIQRRIYFTEKEASMIIKDLASAIQFLHKKGIRVGVSLWTSRER